MESYNKDKILNVIRSQIKKNKESLLDQYKELSNIKNTNTFLELVFDDYNNYYNYIDSIKKDQEIQILRLLHYLEKNLLEANLTDKMTREALHEQKILLERLENIRNDMQVITQQITQ